MALTFPIKRNARHPKLKLFIQDTDEHGAAIPSDLTGAVSATFRMKRPATGAERNPPLLISKAAVLGLPLTDGWVRYDWGAGDLPVAGRFLGEFVIRFSAVPDDVLVAPCAEPISIVVSEAL